MLMNQAFMKDLVGIFGKVNKTCLENLFETLLCKAYGFCETLYKKYEVSHQ